MIDNNSNLPSNTVFGLLFVIVFLALGVYGFLVDWNINIVKSLFIFSVITGTVTIFFSDLLLPFNKLWYQFGLLLGKVVSPIVLGLIFFMLITPVALVTRLAGRDVLRLRKKVASSYWIIRTPPGPDPKSYKDQF